MSHTVASKKTRLDRVRAYVYVSLLLIAGNAAGDTFKLDFDNIASIGHGTLIGGQYSLANGGILNSSGAGVGVGVDIFARNNDRDPAGTHNWAVAYDTEANDPADPDLNGFPGIEPENILIINENDTGCGAHASGDTCSDPDDEGTQFRSGGQIVQSTGFFQFDFSDDVTLTGIDFFDVEPGENGNSDHNEVLFFGLNSSGVLVQMGAPLYTPDTGGDNQWKPLVFNVTGVRRLIVELAGSGGIDNIAGVTTGVPEPATILLLSSGLLLLRGSRRKTAPTAL